MHYISDLISHLFEWIQSLGYFGIMIGLMIEVIPSEIVLAYGGYLVSQGDVNFFGAVLFGTVGGVIAQIFVYWIGRYGGRPVLEKYGKYILSRKNISTIPRNGSKGTALVSSLPRALFRLSATPSLCLPEFHACRWVNSPCSQRLQ